MDSHSPPPPPPDSLLPLPPPPQKRKKITPRKKVSKKRGKNDVDNADDSPRQKKQKRKKEKRRKEKTPEEEEEPLPCGWYKYKMKGGKYRYGHDDKSYTLTSRHAVLDLFVESCKCASNCGCNKPPTEGGVRIEEPHMQRNRGVRIEEPQMKRKRADSERIEEPQRKRMLQDVQGDKEILPPGFKVTRKEEIIKIYKEHTEREFHSFQEAWQFYKEKDDAEEEENEG